jgi:two-component sensor histidine kinase
MKGDSVLRKIIYSSGFLAIIPAFVIMMFISPVGSKFTLLMEPAAKLERNYFFEDLNSDGISEAVLLAKGNPYYFIAVRDSDMKFYDQWNLTDSCSSRLSGFFFGNYDHDRYKEIYIFTYKGDSLFLNVNEFLEHHGTMMDRIFITKVGYLKGEVTSIVRPAGFFDENGDGKDELYFSIATGFSLQPRKMYYYDLVNKKLDSSQLSGTISINPKMEDINGDGKPEIFGEMSASGNYKTKIQFSDSSTWLMVFDDHLKLEFDPVEFHGYANGLNVSGFKNNDFKAYVVSHTVGGNDSTILSPRIAMYSNKGKLLKSKSYSDMGLTGYVSLFVVKHPVTDKIYLFANKFSELNENLETVRSIDLPFHYYNVFQTDINDDGNTEFLVYSEDQEKLIVYSEGLKKLTELKFKTSDLNWKMSHYVSKHHEHKLYLQAGENGYYLKLRKNNGYFISNLIYPGIYLLFLGFIIFIKKINTWQVVQKESLNRRLVTLQLQGIKSQLDPHFTFNILNSISSLIYLEDRHLAYDYMNKFTHLLRSLINDAERIYRSLGEELEFVTTYLELEKLRFGDKFNFDIIVGENISQREQVPKLVLQTFAENAIKHGFMSRKGGGILKIRVIKWEDYLILSIEDNGIGRAKAEGLNLSTGKGLKLTGEFYNILNQINKKPIKHSIIDLHNNSGEAIGTRVEVWVPLN